MQFTNAKTYVLALEGHLRILTDTMTINHFPVANILFGEQLTLIALCRVFLSKILVGDTFYPTIGIQWEGVFFWPSLVGGLWGEAGLHHFNGVRGGRTRIWITVLSFIFSKITVIP